MSLNSSRFNLSTASISCASPQRDTRPLEVRPLRRDSGDLHTRDVHTDSLMFNPPAADYRADPRPVGAGAVVPGATALQHQIQRGVDVENGGGKTGGVKVPARHPDRAIEGIQIKKSMAIKETVQLLRPHESEQYSRHGISRKLETGEGETSRDSARGDTMAETQKPTPKDKSSRRSNVPRERELE